MSDSQEASVRLMHPGSITDAPSPSSFVLKLMTYLRMANINYTPIETLKSSSKGKIPFIMYKGKEITDSAFIIEFVNKEFKVDLNSGLSETEKAVSLAFQRMCEENLYWNMVYHRWFDGKEKFFEKFDVSGALKVGMKIFATLKFVPATKANLKGHGMGRHSADEIYRIGERDITALSTFLGEKQFFMGDEPSEVDAAIFGLMAQYVYVLIGAKEEDLIKEKFSNIIAYCDRMKAKYWPDWDELCSHKK